MSRTNRTIPGDRFCPSCRRPVSARHFLSSGKPRCDGARWWTPGRVWRLMELVERGWSDARIAEALSVEWGRRFTTSGIEQTRERHGVASRGQTHLTAREVARMLGVPCVKTVIRWMANGWLVALNRRTRTTKQPWIVTRVALWDFVEISTHWHRWNPDRVSDPALRQHVDRVRQGVRFVTAGEAARILQSRGIHVQPGTVEQWVKKEYLPSVSTSVQPGRDRGNRLIPLTAVQVVEPPRIGGHRPSHRRQEAA